MNNFRHPLHKPFGGRGVDMSSPWMNDEEFLNMRRQNPQFHSPMHMNPNMHSPLLNQGNMFPSVNKNFMNQGPCKMPGPNFTRVPNPEIFKSPLMNDLNYQNRLLGNRFPNNSYSQMNMQPKMNDSPSYKDFAPSNMMPSQGHRSDGFSDCISKPLLSNIRSSQDTFSCMQNDQSQFNSKYDNSRMFPEKNFPFSNDKDFQSHNHTPVNEPVSLGSNFSSYKPNYRAPSLFPAYTPKTMSDESTKNIPASTYNSDFTSKANNFCDKTETSATFAMKTSNYCDKPVTSSVVYSTSMESFTPKSEFQGKTEKFQGKAESFQGKVDSFQEKIDSFQNKAESFLERNVSDRIVNEFFPPHSTNSSFMFDKQPLKTLSNSQLSHDTFKTVEDPVLISSNPKFVYPPASQEPCLSTEISMQKSPMLPNHPSTTSSKDCLMQNVPFTSQSEIQQNLKENFSSINFESNMSTTDIADLLPGIDAFLKEHLEKSDEIVSKNDTSKTASNCTFSDDEWSKHSIPFIGDNLSLTESNIQDGIKEASCDQSIGVKDTSDQLEVKFQKETEIPAINKPVDSASVVENVSKMGSAEREESKARSALEEAIELLVTNDTIVGLDYIIEYKRNIAHEGSIPFRCKLCNSAITRPSIIDHILGSKHRMRYLKAKNEPKYEQIVNLKLEKSEKDTIIAEAVSELEKIYGRGSVIVDSVEYQKDSSIDNSSKEEEGTVEPVFTLDKIPIGFEALSPQHEEINEFSLENSINQVNEERNIFKNESPNTSSSAGIIKDASSASTNAKITLPGLGCDTIYDTKTNSNSILSETIPSSVEQNICSITKNSDQREVQNSQATSVKRSMSPDSTFRSKIQKTNCEESKPDSTDLKTLEVKNEDSCDLKGFSLNILEKLSKSTISSEEEASVVLQVINVFMELLLRYKLQHLSVEKVEKLMKLLQTKSPENIEELSSLLKDYNGEENNNVEKSSSSLKDNDNIHLKSNTMFEEDLIRPIKQEYSNCLEKGSIDISEPEIPEKNISDNFASDSVISTKSTQSVSNTSASFTVSQNSTLAALDNTTVVSKNVTEFSCMSQTTCLPSQAQISNSSGLKPPPFFSWPQTSEAVTNQVSYANVQGSQNMMWTSPYQHTQTQYAQLPYYQQHNYGNTYSGTQTYQAQYPVLSQNSVPMKMAQPPLPPPPPPPPPTPGNPPLPPLPSSVYSSVSSHSMQMPINTPPCVSTLYSKQTFLPPPLP